MKNIIVLGALCFAISGCTSVQTKSNEYVNTDWTPLFKSWEKGCEYSADYQKFVNSIRHENIVLPTSYLNAISGINKKHTTNGDYYDTSIDVKHGTYYGMRVKKIGYLMGVNHGLSTGYIELSPNDAQLREFLANVKFNQTYRGEVLDDYVKADIKVSKKKMIISCDIST